MWLPRANKLVLALSLALSLCMTASAQPAANSESKKQPAANASAQPVAADPLGTAKGASIACRHEGLAGGSCYAVDISCPGVNDFTGYVKVNYPARSSIGTVVFTTGGTGNQLYETEYIYGKTALDELLDGEFTVAQVTWGDPFADQPGGWETGPGGIRDAACRYATIALWIYDNVHQKGTDLPFCATGNSGGGEQIGEALAHYGLAPIFAMVEPTSGPPFARQDWACDCLQPEITNVCGNVQGYCVGLSNAKRFVDPAYSAPLCSEEVTTHDTTYDAIFLQDSIMAPDAELSYPHTFVKFIYGGQDTGAAANQGQLWEDAITTLKDEACVEDAPHNIADVLDGAEQIAHDILTYCQLPDKR
jgi:hypothetical protein